MEEEVVTAAPDSTGDGAETPSTATQTEAQVSSEPQIESPAKVESADNVSQAIETQRRKPSDYYRERDRYRRLEDALRLQNQKVEEMTNLLRELRNPKPAVSEAEKFDVEQFWKDPASILSDRERKLREEIVQLKQGFEQIQTQAVQSQRQSAMREALELLFPKESPESTETLEQRIQKNPEYVERVQEILNAPAISKLAEIDPRSAAEVAKLRLDALKTPPSPKAIPKTLMGSTARGNPGGAKVTVESKMAELKKLSREVEANPSLRMNVEHKAKRDQVMREIDGLLREERK